MEMYASTEEVHLASLWPSTFDLWPWKSFHPCPLTCRIFFGDKNLSTKILCHPKEVFKDNGRTTGKHSASRCLLSYEIQLNRETMSNSNKLAAVVVQCSNKKLTFIQLNRFSDETIWHYNIRQVFSCCSDGRT